MYTPRTQRPPIVPARALPRMRDGSCWTIEIDCPYCPRKHQHGGGDDKEPKIAGTVVPHCRDIHYRNRLIFDSRVVDRHLPQYELAPEDSSEIDWDAEKRYASALLEEAEMALQEEDDEAAEKNAKGHEISEQLYGLIKAGVTHSARNAKSGNSAYLEAWKARQETSE